MGYCDFASIMAIIREYIGDGWEMTQPNLTNMIFGDFFEHVDYAMDNTQVNRWYTGSAQINSSIKEYYQGCKHRKELENDINKNILPMLSDSAMVVEKLNDLVWNDVSVSEQKKEELTEGYPFETDLEKAGFIAELLEFALERNVVKREGGTVKPVEGGSLSPAVSGHIMGVEPPAPCRYFCGRDREIECLHEMLAEYGKVFLSGIPGIGKSELAKAYAKAYKKDYTNILYVAYSGDLYRDIADMYFSDDRFGESTEQRYSRHHRFLQSLRPDSLIIIDNFNVLATEDRLLPVVMRYQCRVLFTTRSVLENYTTMQVEEISDKGALEGLMEKYCPGAGNYRKKLEQIIDLVHCHTLAVELAARLLARGSLTPNELLRRLKKEKVALDSSDRISITKDGKPAKETYYGHIHLLFALYGLDEGKKTVLRGMALVPSAGIEIRLMRRWLGFADNNVINDLMEMGLIRQTDDGSAALHPMIQEVVCADLKPSVINCRVMLENVTNDCLRHGEELPYYRVLFQTVENVIRYAEKDDSRFYLTFLETAGADMGDYDYRSGISMVAEEMERILSDFSVGEDKDLALLCEMRGLCETDVHEKIKREKEALSYFPEVNADNAGLVSNFTENLGVLYREAGRDDFARQHYEKAIRIRYQYDLYYSHDFVIQCENYGSLLCDMGETDKAVSVLEAILKVCDKYPDALSRDRAHVMICLSEACLKAGKHREAEKYAAEGKKLYGEQLGESERIRSQSRKN